MKKMTLILPLVLCGCITMPPPAEQIRNPKCSNTDMIKVVQVDDDIVLVQSYNCLRWANNYGWVNDNTCSDSRGYTLKNDGELLAVNKKDLNGIKKDLYDGLKIVMNDKGCITTEGTYAYISTTGAKKTVRKVKFIDANITNPEYTKWKEEQDAKTKVEASDKE